MAQKGTLKPKRISANGSLTFYLSLTLHPDRDQEIISELLATPMGSVAAKLREMLRNGTLSDHFTLTDGSVAPVEIAMGDMDVGV